MSFRFGLITHLADYRSKFLSSCIFKTYEFSKEEERAHGLFKKVGGRLDCYRSKLFSFVDFSMAKVWPAIVHVSREKEIGGSGIIIDSEGTVLTRAHKFFSLDSISQIYVNLMDRKQFPATILQVNKDHGLALLKIQSNIPLPITTLGSLNDCDKDGLISIEHSLRRWAEPRPSSKIELDDENYVDYLDLISIEHPNEEDGYAGPIVNLDGEVVGISTNIGLIRKLNDKVWSGILDVMPIEKALWKAGYLQNGEDGVNEYDFGRLLKEKLF